MNLIVLLIYGIVIGMANIIPGVSGGTLAVVFNIYDEFVNAITFNVKKIWGNRKFVFPLLTGMLSGIVIFSKLFTVLYENFPVQINYLFTGLIVGSIPMIFGYAVKHEKDTKLGAGKIASICICALMGFALLLVFAYYDKVIDKSSDMNFILPELSVRLTFRIFIAGILGAIAMIVPGISGSLLMLILGVYPIIITSIPAMFHPETFVHAVLLLLPNGVGVLLGLLCGAKLIAWFLKKAPNQSYSVILGLLFGSIINVFPGFAVLESVKLGIFSVLCFVVGFLMAYLSSKMEFKKA